MGKCVYVLNASNILFVIVLLLEILICIVQIRALNKQDNNKEFVICAGDAVLHANVWHVSTQFTQVQIYYVCTCSCMCMCAHKGT